MARVTGKQISARKMGTCKSAREVKRPLSSPASAQQSSVCSEVQRLPDLMAVEDQALLPAVGIDVHEIDLILVSLEE